MNLLELADDHTKITDNENLSDQDETMQSEAIGFIEDYEEPDPKDVIKEFVL